MNRLKSSAGFTLIAAMAMMVIMGIMAGAAAQSWQTLMKREREEELIFRGMQYMSALKRWYNPNFKTVKPGMPQLGLIEPGNSPKPLKDLKFLLEDNTTPNMVKHLRRLYIDPITNKDFVPIINPINQAIIGVKSTSEAEPLKKGNFPDELQGLNDKKSYAEWEFVYTTRPISKATKTGVTGLPGSTVGTSGMGGMGGTGEQPH